MKHRLTASVTLLAITLSGLTPGAADARHKRKKDDNNLVPLILGAAALGLLMNQMNQGQGSRVTTVPARPFASDDYRFRDDGSDDYYGRAYQSAQVIPTACVMDVNVSGRLREVVSGRCLGQYGLGSRLPADCAFDVRTMGGPRTVYGERCLKSYGYRVEGAGYDY